MITNKWWRSWHGAPTDPKWLYIARRAEVVPGIVAAVVWALYDHASQAVDRGDVSRFDVETLASFYGFEEKQIQAVVNALKEKGVIKEDRLAAWEKWQRVNTPQEHRNGELRGKRRDAQRRVD